MVECPKFSCTKEADTFTAVITNTDDKEKKFQWCGSPMVLCKDHAEDRRLYFEEIGRSTKIIENYIGIDKNR